MRPKKQSYRATIWQNMGACYGIRFSVLDAQEFVEWMKIPVELDEKLFSFPLRKDFNPSCPEIRGRPLQRWFEKRGVSLRNKDNYVVRIDWQKDRFLPKLEPC